MNEAKRQRLIGALLRERKGLAARKRDDRVKQVDDELERLGYVERKTGLPKKKKTEDGRPEVTKDEVQGPPVKRQKRPRRIGEAR